MQIPVSSLTLNRKRDKDGFSWTDSKGQIWNAYEYGTKGEAFY